MRKCMGISFVIIEGNYAFDVRLYALCVFSVIIFLFLFILIISFLFRSFIVSLNLHLSVSPIFIKDVSLLFTSWVRVIIWFISLIPLLELLVITCELINLFFVTGFCLLFCLQISRLIFLFIVIINTLFVTSTSSSSSLIIKFLLSRFFMELSLWVINCSCHCNLVCCLIHIICQSWWYSLCLFLFHCACKKYVTSNYWCLRLTLYGPTSSKYFSLELNTRFHLWRFKHWLIILNPVLGLVFLYFSISSPLGIVFPVSINDVEFIFVEVSVAFSVDACCNRLFMSYFVGSFQWIGVWQQLSRLSLLSCFLCFGVSTWGSLSSLVLVKLYFPCLFMLILYGLQLIPISLVPCIPLSSVDGSFLWCSEFVSVLLFCQGLQKLWWHMFMFLLFLRNLDRYFAVYWYPYFDVISNIKFFCWVEALLWCIIDIIIHTIKDAAGIANCGTLCISGWWSFNWKVSQYVLAVQTIHHWMHER